MKKSVFEFGVRKGFLNKISKVQSTKQEANAFNYNQIRGFLFNKSITNQVNEIGYRWRECICSNKNN
jgi:hypothetical protein